LPRLRGADYHHINYRHIIFQCGQDGSFLDRKENVLAFGTPGGGKSHLLAALGQKLVKTGHRVYFTSTSLMVQELLRAKIDLN
jgi:DNA replication protein DnaC